MGTGPVNTEATVCRGWVPGGEPEAGENRVEGSSERRGNLTLQVRTFVSSGKTLEIFKKGDALTKCLYL